MMSSAGITGFQGTISVPGKRNGPPADAWRACFLGAGDRTRTGDIQLGKLTLYQLSYTRVRGTEIRLRGWVVKEVRRWRALFGAALPALLGGAGQADLLDGQDAGLGALEEFGDAAHGGRAPGAAGGGIEALQASGDVDLALHARAPEVGAQARFDTPDVVPHRGFALGMGRQFGRAHGAGEWHRIGTCRP